MSQRTSARGLRGAAPASRSGYLGRAAYEALRSGDLSGVGSYFADDAMWEAPDAVPTGGVIRGPDAVLER